MAGTDNIKTCVEIESAVDPIETADPTEPLTEEQYQAAKQQRLKQKQLTKLLHEAEQYKQRGIVYISSIPHSMQPTQIKQYLSMYNNAVIHRIYCQPMNNKSKHNKSHHTSYLDGWIEFDNKHVAKQLCTLLNGKPMGGKKHSKFYDCLWNLKYLTGFKWNHLTDKLHSDRVRHTATIRNEMQLAQQESEQYSRTVQLAQYRERKKRRNELHDSDMHQQQFKQRKMIDNVSNTE